MDGLLKGFGFRGCSTGIGWFLGSFQDLDTPVFRDLGGRSKDLDIAFLLV